MTTHLVDDWPMSVCGRNMKDEYLKPVADGWVHRVDLAWVRSDVRWCPACRPDLED